MKDRLKHIALLKFRASRTLGMSIPEAIHAAAWSVIVSHPGIAAELAQAIVNEAVPRDAEGLTAHGRVPH